MNKKICIIIILITSYMFIKSILIKDYVFIIYYLIGLIMLVIALAWEIKKSSMYQQLENIQIPYTNFVLHYIFLGVNIKNLIRVINSDTIYKLIFAEGAIAFSIMYIYEYIRFFKKRTKKSSKILYGIVIGIEVIKFIILNIYTKGANTFFY